MGIHILPAFEDNYIFVLHDGDHALVVDPGDPDVVMQHLTEHRKALAVILQTHHHWDHTDGTPILKQAFPNAKVITPYFQKGRFPVSTQVVKEGDHITFGGWNFVVMKTPGHTFDHISYYDAGRNVLFCGDTLFHTGCGRIFDGSMEGLFLSLQKLKSLPDKTLVYCTHEYTLDNIRFAKTLHDSDEMKAWFQDHEAMRKKGHFTIPFVLGPNKKMNPFLQASSLESFAKVRTQKDQWRP